MSGSIQTSSQVAAPVPPPSSSDDTGKSFAQILSEVSVGSSGRANPPDAQAAAPQSASGAVHQAAGFVQGFGEGVWDGVKGAAQGIGHLATGAYHFAADPNARQQDLDAAGSALSSAGSAVVGAVKDPGKATSEIADTAKGAVNKLATSYEAAAAKGEAGEFIGTALGEGVAAVGGDFVPGGAEAEAAGAFGDLGRASEAIGDAGKAAHVTGETADAAQGVEAARQTAERAGQTTEQAVGDAEPVLASKKDVPLRPDGYTDTDPPIRLDHITDGEINKAGKAVGYHARPGGTDAAGSRMTQIVKQPDKAGVYVGRVEVDNPATGQPVPKHANSSFFPDSLSKQQITDGVMRAFQNSGLQKDGMFRGDSGLGFQIEGWYRNGKIESAYPLRGHQP